MISFSQRVQIALIYTSIEQTCNTLIIKTKKSICACSIVSRVFIYASNKALCGTLIKRLWKKLTFCMLMQANKNILESNKNTRYALAI